MNTHELNAWNTLVQIGALQTEIGGKQALDLRPIRVSSQKRLCLLLRAFHEVAGHSMTVRRHVDRYGAPIFVVRDS